MGVQSCDPTSEPQNPRALRARLAECAAKVGTCAGSPGEGGGQASASVCARVCVGASAGSWGRVCVEVCVGDKRDPGETSASHRLREPVRVLLK